MHVYVRYNKKVFDLSKLMHVLTQHITDLTLELVNIDNAQSHYDLVCATGLPPHCVTINVIDSFKAFQNARTSSLGLAEDVYIPFTSLPLRSQSPDDSSALSKSLSQELLLSMVSAPILKLVFMRWESYGPC